MKTEKTNITTEIFHLQGGGACITKVGSFSAIL